MNDRIIIDGHLHLSPTRTASRLCNVDDMRAILDGAGLDALCVQSIVLWKACDRLRNPAALLLKLREPRAYAFGGLMHPEPGRMLAPEAYAAQALRLYGMGFDGIKLFGKPRVRRTLGIAYDAPQWRPLFAALEREQIPVMFHLGDPREFWNRETAPEFARQNGFVYDEPEDIPFDCQYEEIDRLLERFPQLSVVFAHFFFLSDDLERLAGFLDRYPAMRIDITPGDELYRNLSARPDEAKDFFRRYADRIQFGTDNTGVPAGKPFDPAARARARVQAIWEFLSGEETMAWGKPLKGLSLPSEILGKITHRNFRAFAGQHPRPVDRPAAAAFAREVQNQVLQMQADRQTVEQTTAVCQALCLACADGSQRLMHSV